MVDERTTQISQQKVELEETLNTLKSAQTKLIASEKMASLGQLTAGIEEIGTGTGLGLYISYGNINQHHGTIEVLSKPGEGTEIIIKLPLEKSTP